LMKVGNTAAGKVFFKKSLLFMFPFFIDH